MRKHHEHLWAKSLDEEIDKDGNGESLYQHSLNVAHNAQKICQRLPFSKEQREELAEKLLEAGALHDIGKAASGFQKMLREKNWFWGHRHETLSTALACALNPNLDETVLFAILTHHRDIPTGSDDKSVLPTGELPPDFFYTGETVQWEEMLKHLRENWSDFQAFLEDLARELRFTWTTVDIKNDLMSLGIDNTWLYRDGDGQGKQIEKERRWQASLLRGLLITSDHLASAVDREKGVHPEILDVPKLVDFEDAIKRKELPEGKDLLPYQKKASEAKGDAILKAPTGAGKTLAAMLWASRNQSENGRFYYVLPFTASINAMARRFIEIFDRENVGVLHHKNADFLFRLMEKDEMSLKLKNQQAKHLKSLAREMYHPIRISTPHQILRFALRGRGWETGLSEFVNSCVVYDEVHAFEPLITGLTLATAKLLQSDLFNAKILFTSATIPKFLERLIMEELGIDELHVIEPDPNDEKDMEVTDKKRHKIEIREGNLYDNLHAIVSEIKTLRQSTLIFCNHVKTSQQVYEKLKEGYGFTDLTLLHSRFNGRDRTEIETIITRKKSNDEKKKSANLIEKNPLLTPILVATQAVEVSLDIDYECGYSEPAPADALGQRLGRVNRKGKRPPAKVVIFAEPTNGYLYDQALTGKTIELLRAVTAQLSEQELTDIVDKVYEGGYPQAAQDEFERGLNNSSIKNFAKDMIAGTHITWTDAIFENTDAQIEVLPQTLFDEFSLLKKQSRLIEARQLLVPMRWGQYHKAKKMNAIRCSEKLHEPIVTLAYDKKKGLDSDKLDGENIL